MKKRKKFRKIKNKTFIKKENILIVSDADKEIFLEAMDFLNCPSQDLLEKKFDFRQQNKTFVSRKRKSSYREASEKIQAFLDLHGFSRNEAIDRLDKFCHQAVINGWRTVKIITGKGIHSPDGKMILKNEVIHWLNSEKGQCLVELYRPASRQQGGSGAFILYLYKRK